MAISSHMRNEVFQMCDGTCAKCHRELVPFAGASNSLDVDHIVPLSFAGPDMLFNLQPMCAKCNRSKGDREAYDYRPPAIQQRYEAERSVFCEENEEVLLDAGHDIIPGASYRDANGNVIYFVGKDRPARSARDWSGSTRSSGRPLAPPVLQGVTVLQLDPPGGFGWRLRWRYGWMGRKSWVPIVFWLFFYWLVLVWAVAWVFHQFVQRAGRDRFSSGTATKISISGAVLFLFLLAQCSGGGSQSDSSGTPAAMETSVTSPPVTSPPVTSPPVTSPPTGDCHPAYPDHCIPSAPPDLNCGDIEASKKPFTVNREFGDPHGFDRDGDGRACEG